MSFCNFKKNTLQALRNVGALVNYCLLILSINLLMISVSSATEDSVGHATIVIGSAYIEKEGQKKKIRQGDKISSGDTIVTRSNGHVHIKFDDQGIVSVRPNSKLIIEQYIYNVETPSLSTVKFDLIKGVARSISGRAAKAARSRFRMNTPIAAIGVRGTDFIVSATDKAIKAFVNEGVIVVSPFSDLCSASTLGPCGAAAVELHGNSNQLLELHNQQALATVRLIKTEALPRLLYESQSSDEGVTPSDEPLKSNNEEQPQEVIEADDSTSDKGLDEDKKLNDTITQSVEKDEIISEDTVLISIETVATQTDSIVVIKDSETTQINIDTVLVQGESTIVIEDADTDLLKPELTKDLSTVDSFSYVIPNDPIASGNLTKRQLVWGRWNIDSTQQLISTNYQEAAEGREISVSNDIYGLFRYDDGEQTMAANLGSVSFNLHFADVDYFTLSGSSPMVVTAGFLDMDFNSRSFTTGLSLNSTPTGDVNFQAKGSISDKGLFTQPNGTSTLGGAVSFDGKEAAYFFDQKLENGTIKGTTLWGAP
jgi:hypothetical protein